MKNANQKPESIIPSEPAVTQPPSGKTGLKGKVRQILMILGFTLLGVLIGAVVLYFFAVLQLKDQVTGLNQTIDRTNSALAANQAASLLKGEALAQCTVDLDAAESEIALAQKVNSTLELMYEVSSAQQALLSNDHNTAGTRLSLAKKYLVKLTTLIDDDTELKGLEAPLEDAIIKYQAKPAEAISQLDALIKTLHQLIDSLRSNG